jgi:hypothetical protein
MIMGFLAVTRYFKNKHTSSNLGDSIAMYIIGISISQQFQQCILWETSVPGLMCRETKLEITFCNKELDGS